ncbi:deaminase-reductase domain-containing protein [Amycolatopsis mediterranei S699]|uniref:Deaminase-reductase domain-containing protein n=2 Tax=Amycolatopsis mediterranei TaxID=33910 RepID=A0A0H3CWU2_AMYMU|nr:dihydrofolate reductase family protein [Amycolatopsis mediterranei]ADJ42783.1 deaminase-reductase domain-containing protein [Amycolatopsis mediterranei U32]AEK39474.1 deaminase-reductase domain-containing protein [Amycolatopsis mediterranei S699]AFO74498.1 deaminase-reductase domain-containing protein [Amycolatopsis mediterranei S699]AGT81627.1 deaminase-reductase domain-containing protein [Amycolatopsis mediterranei RB]UZF67936.1 dihydrofolate reductase family protein [Amycolatopsis medite
MADVIANMSMSLDGFVADPEDRIDHLFEWFGNGDVQTSTAVDWATFKTSEASAKMLRAAMENVGALLTGRRLFNLTQGWGGTHPMGVPVFVVTHQEPAEWPHPDAPFTFVTDGLESAVEQAKKTAGDKIVAVASTTIAQQCLNLGLLDGVQVDLIPVLLGSGVRFFDHLDTTTELTGPEVVEGTGVTHLSYRVKR